MKILVVNDDGINSHNLKRLVQLIKYFGYVYVSTPSEEKSKTSRSITVKNKIKIKKVTPLPGSERTIVVDGTPADCVRVANKLFYDGFDLTIVGINNGLNVGYDINYSATVGAAIESRILNTPALALSIPYDITDQLEPYVSDLLGVIIKNGLTSISDILNINFPDTKPKGIKITEQGSKLFYADYSLIKENDYEILYSIVDNDVTKDTDSKAIEDGYISITPLKINQTDHESILKLKKVLKYFDK